MKKIKSKNLSELDSIAQAATALGKRATVTRGEIDADVPDNFNPKKKKSVGKKVKNQP